MRLVVAASDVPGSSARGWLAYHVRTASTFAAARRFAAPGSIGIDAARHDPGVLACIGGRPPPSSSPSCHTLESIGRRGGSFFNASVATTTIEDDLVAFLEALEGEGPPEELLGDPSQ